MTKDKKIDVFFPEDIFCVEDQPFPVLSQESLLIHCGSTAPAAEVICKSHPHYRRENTKQEFTDGIAEQFFQSFIPVVARPQTVTVSSLRSLASWNLRISAGSTWLVLRS